MLLIQNHFLFHATFFIQFNFAYSLDYCPPFLLLFYNIYILDFLYLIDSLTVFILIYICGKCVYVLALYKPLEKWHMTERESEKGWKKLEESFFLNRRTIELIWLSARDVSFLNHSNGKKNMGLKSSSIFIGVWKFSLVSYFFYLEIACSKFQNRNIHCLFLPIETRNSRTHFQHLNTQKLSILIFLQPNTFFFVHSTFGF